MQVHALGTMAVLVDPTGATIGAWQPGEMPGFGLVAEPGAPAWFELHTRGYDTAVSFYRDVFGWNANTMSDTPEFRYTTLNEGEEQHAGIMDSTAMPDDVRSFWAVYFNVEDADATLARADELGRDDRRPGDRHPLRPPRDHRRPDRRDVPHPAAVTGASAPTAVPRFGVTYPHISWVGDAKTGGGGCGQVGLTWWRRKLMSEPEATRST